MEVKQRDMRKWSIVILDIVNIEINGYTIFFLERIKET